MWVFRHWWAYDKCTLLLCDLGLCCCLCDICWCINSITHTCIHQPPTHPHVACDLEWVAVYFYRTFLNIHRSDVLTTLFGLLHGWCYVKLLQSWRKFCVHYTTMRQFTVSLSWIHIPRVYVCLVVTCHLHFGQNKQALLHATVVKQGWNGYQNGHQHEQNVYLEEENSCATPAETQPATFWSGVWLSTPELSLLPLSRPSHKLMWWK